MEDRERRLVTPQGRGVAFAATGSGPVLVEVQGWLSHLDIGWAIPEERRFHEGLTTGRTLRSVLAEAFAAVRVWASKDERDPLRDHSMRPTAN